MLIEVTKIFSEYFKQAALSEQGFQPCKSPSATRMCSDGIEQVIGLRKSHRSSEITCEFGWRIIDDPTFNELAWNVLHRVGHLIGAGDIWLDGEGPQVKSQTIPLLVQWTDSHVVPFLNAYNSPSKILDAIDSGQLSPYMGLGNHESSQAFRRALHCKRLARYTEAAILFQEVVDRWSEDRDTIPWIMKRFEAAKLLAAQMREASKL